MNDLSSAAALRAPSIDSPPTRQSRRVGPPETLLLFVVLLATALATRAQFLGNPILDSDEGFYLLVGDRMLHGALPYVDIWDRKPVGLFLLYAGMRALGGDGVLAYQLVGTIVVASTALLIARIARIFADRLGAASAGIAYLIWMTLGSAEGGQAELFYALPVCAAGAITMRGVCERLPRDFGRRGSVAMLLIGIAAQIKYNALFEGMFFGCCWLLVAWRAGCRAPLPGLALLWIAVAVAPTAAALSFYALRGQLEPFFFANFLSIWHRGSPWSLASLGGLKGMVIILAPLLACARLRPFPQSRAASAALRFTLCWLAASGLSVLAFGTYLEQYLLPILVPASAAAAPLLGRSKRGTAVFLSVFLLLGQAKLCITQEAHGSKRQLAAITQHIDRSGCLYVYSGLSALYRISGTCLATRFAFPSHLSRAREANAVGVRPVTEIRRIMASHPATVIVRSPYDADENWVARAETLRLLRPSYHSVFSGPLGWKIVDVYRLSAGRPPVRTAG